MRESTEIRLLHGPYQSPKVRRGQILRCRIRGDVPVVRFSDGRIPWPRGRITANGGRGTPAYILCGDLERALQRESVIAVCYWWGVGTSTVCTWRRRLGVEEFNEGTLQLWSSWRRKKLPHGTTEPVVSFSAAAMRARRLSLGLPVREVARRAGWKSLNSYSQYERGNRRRVTKATLAKIATALACRVGELI